MINLYGPADLTTPFSVTKSVVVDFLGGKEFADANGLYRLASPVTHVSPDDPPTLIFHGTIDRVVPIRQAELLVTRLREAGAAHQFVRIEGWPHAMDAAAEVNAHCLAQMFAFLDQHLPVPPSAADEGSD